MDIFLIILGSICLLLGFIGCIVPALPGVPLAYGALWLLHATDLVQFDWTFLLIWGIVTIVVQVLDYVVPAWGTKMAGGSKLGVWGTTVGLLVGLFFGPWGIIVGPFVGAVLFEWIGNHDWKKAFQSGWGSFLGFLMGTILKMICCGFMTYYFITAII